jgi:hypothetical protein
MWPLKTDSGKRLKAAASVLAWRLDDVRETWRIASREGRLHVARALCAIERTLQELWETDLGSVDVERSDRLFAVIERANRVIDRMEGRLHVAYPIAS